MQIKNLKFKINNKLRSKNCGQNGQSMFEVVIAIFIISLIIVGVVAVSTNSVSNSTFSRNSTLAGRYAQEGIEWVRDEKTKDIILFKSKVPQSLYCLDNLVWTNIATCNSSEVIPNTVFRRNLRLTSSTINSKIIIEAVVRVLWDDSKGTHEVSSTTNFSDIRER